MKLLICIVGGSGSGKSTLESDIIINDGFTKAVSSTTRKKRDGEQNEREYYFIDDNMFVELKNQNQMVESVEFLDKKYGLTKNEFYKNDDHLVFVVEPNGLQQILEYLEKNDLDDIVPLIIHTDIPQKDRFKNMVKRGDSPVNIQDRLNNETIDEEFVKSGLKPNIHITKLNDNTSDIVMEKIQEFLEEL